jgi:hypothetical protein
MFRHISAQADYQWWWNRSRSQIPRKARETPQKDQPRRSIDRSIEGILEDIFLTGHSNWSHRIAILKPTSWHVIYQFKMMIESWEKKNLPRTTWLAEINPYEVSNNKSGNYPWNLWGDWRVTQNEMKYPWIEDKYYLLPISIEGMP